jgi:cellulose biosynthesis protein BcsQ
MNTPVVTFFNNRVGAGKTSLVYHLSFMLAKMGVNVLVLDLDPQARLTTAFVEESGLEQLWIDSSEPTTIYRSIEPLTRMRDLLEPLVVPIDTRLHLIAGDISLSNFEEFLSSEWPDRTSVKSLDRSFRAITAFWQVARMAARKVEADLIIVDIGPNFTAINRSALIAGNAVIIPLGADICSLQALRNLGPVLGQWRQSWQELLENSSHPDFPLPTGEMKPLGYSVRHYNLRLGNPIEADDRWFNLIPRVYHETILGELIPETSPGFDRACLATIKHYRSLMEMGQQARKPIFSLKPADGAVGAHALAVLQSYRDFENLARTILEHIGDDGLLSAANLPARTPAATIKTAQ